jgi:hypothetical protein
MTLMKKRDFIKAAAKLALGSISAFYLEPFMADFVQKSLEFHPRKIPSAGLDVIPDTIPTKNWPVRRNFGIIEIGDRQLRASKNNIKNLKNVFDKLETYYVLDGVVYNCTEATVTLLKAVYEVDCWKVEKDGSVNLNSKYGHNGCFEYEEIHTDRLPEIRTFKRLNAKLNSEEFKIMIDLIKAFSSEYKVKC